MPGFWQSDGGARLMPASVKRSGRLDPQAALIVLEYDN
jgi:hypothetical protein